MKMGRLINKGKSLIVTVWALSLITTNAEPKLWQVGLIGILMYEVILLFIKTWQRASAKKTYIKNITAGQKDMERVEAVRFGWKMKEVS